MKKINIPIILLIFTDERKEKFLKLKVYRLIKKILKKDFKVKDEDNEKIILIFKNKINFYKDYLKFKKLCFILDCRFKIVLNNKIELYY